MSLVPEWGLPELFWGGLGIPRERRCSPASLMTLSAHSGQRAWDLGWIIDQLTEWPVEATAEGADSS